MPNLIYILLLITFTPSSNLFAQEKFEKESRIKQKDVVAKALSFMDSLHFPNKVKWYKEEGLSGKSIEAKFKYQKALYSVEFDTLGNIEDIEIELNWDDLESNLKDSIFLQLKSNCLKHKIVKVQKQYTGSESQLLSILNPTKNQSLTTKYELIVSCSLQKTVELFEYLFNDNGKIISISKIVFKNSSHLEY